MGVLKPRHARLAALIAIALFIAVVLRVADYRNGWGTSWRAREQATAHVLLDPTEPGARTQLLQHLLIARPPASFPAPTLKNAPLLALYIFSTSNVAGYMRRELIRRHSPLRRLPEEYRSLVQLRFVVGRPAEKTSLLWTLPDDLRAEQDEHNDLFVLEEYVDGGKSIAWMQAVGRGRPVQWVFKANDDTLVYLSNVLDEVLRHSPEAPTYVGTSIGRTTKEQLYFTGSLYGFSWPVVAAVGAANLTEDEVRLPRHEDVRIGDVMLPAQHESLTTLRSWFRSESRVPLCLPSCSGEALDELALSQVDRHDARVHANPRTRLRYVNVLSRVFGWNEKVWWRAGKRTLAWNGLQSDKDWVDAFYHADRVWKPPKWFTKQLDQDQ